MQQSHLLFQRAQVVIPGGVNSPVRAFKAVGGEPFFVKRGEGAYLYDEDGNHYIDYVGSWGPLILGHSHPKVIEAIIFAAKEGLSFGIPNRREIELAEQINYLMPSMEKIRMVSSGTEATMTALRLARGYTGRNKIIKFEGCYHGHNDSLLVKAGSGLLTLGLPSSAGISPEVVRDTLVATYNDLTQVEMLFRTHHPHIAAVIVEPVAGNMNCIPPVPGFLEGLRNLCDQYGAVLIFDEVITGFRVALGGAQGLFNIKPDLTTLGKIIGGGLPVGAVGGQRDIMDYLAPVGPVYQAGTLSGNPVAMAAGLATLEQLIQPEFYESLLIKTTRLLQGITTRAQAAKIPLITQQVGSLFGLFFTELPQVTSYHQVIQTNTSHFTNFFHGMLNNNVYLAPSPFEVGFMSAAHEEHEIEASLLAVENVFSKL